MKEITLGSGSRTIAMLFPHNAAGESSNADATPTAVLYDEFDNNVTTALGESIWNATAGVYFLAVDCGTVISSYLHAATFWGWWEYEIDGVSRKEPIPPFRFVPARHAFVVVAHGSNTATTFKIAAAGPSVSGSTLFGTNDDAADVLVTFASGSLAGQIKKVTAYNAATGFVTVDGAFTGAPSAGDAGFVSNY